MLHTLLNQMPNKEIEKGESSKFGVSVRPSGNTLALQTSPSYGGSGADVKLVLLDRWTFKTGDGAF